MDSGSDRDPGALPDEAEAVGAGDLAEDARAEAAGLPPAADEGCAPTGTAPPVGEKRRLPSIDDYDWEQHIERFARRLSPHHLDAEEEDDRAAERAEADHASSHYLTRRADVPPSLRASYAAAAQAQWQEPRRLRPVAVLLCVAAPLLTAAAALPFAHGVLDGWGHGLDWLTVGNREIVDVVFQPTPDADVPVHLVSRDVPLPSAMWWPAGVADEAASPVLVQQPASLGSVVRVEHLALAAAQERRLRTPAQPSARDRPADAIAGAAAPAIPASVKAAGEAAGLDPGPAEDASAERSAPEEVGTAVPARAAEAAEAAEPAEPQPPLRSLTRREIDSLLAHGHQLLDSGDIASARLLFRLVAEAGDPRGARAMGMTFDPSVFAELPVAGMAHDRAQAELWYDRSDAMPALTAPADRAVTASSP